MAQSGRVFRVFVSSTFADLQAERDILKDVFSRLMDECRPQGARFQGIDMRWGVSEEASLDQRAAAICFEEIQRCQRVSPRPNFLVLLGDRYGSWLPPTHLPSRVFDALHHLSADAARHTLTSWYQLDQNAVPAEYYLVPRTGAYVDEAAWTAAAQALQAIFFDGVARLSVPEDPLYSYHASITEQEILAGVFNLPAASGQACCFFRSIAPFDSLHQSLASNPIAQQYVDTDAAGAFDAHAHHRLAQLKTRLQDRLPGQVYQYEAQWTGNGLSPDYLDQFRKDVYAHLKRVIDAELAQEPSVAQTDRDIAAHWAFAVDRRRHFTGRASVLDAIDRYLTGTAHIPLVIHGDSGAGKSALMAQALTQVQRKLPNARVVARFVGATPASLDEQELLESLCRQISQIYNTDDVTIPADFEGLIQDFPKRLALATEQVPLVLVIDALDQLGSDDLTVNNVARLTWIPSELPESVRLLVSTTSGARLAPLQQRLATESFVELEPMRAGEGEALLGQWLADAQRTLQPQQKHEVLTKFAATGLPLYLKLAFEEARLWKSSAPMAETTLAADIHGLLNQLFDRLSLQSNHGATLVARSLGYLVSAKNGLVEDEMLDVLSGDQDVLVDFRQRSLRSPQVDRLPNLVWSRLYFDLEPYLTERVADGATLMTFYHRQFATAVADRFLAGAEGGARHRSLAEYFQRSANTAQSGGEVTPNLRRLSELPYQQTFGELWQDLTTTLTDLSFLADKSLYVSVSAVEVDLRLAMRQHTAIMPASRRGSALQRLLARLMRRGRAPKQPQPLLASLGNRIGRVSHLLRQAHALRNGGRDVKLSGMGYALHRAATSVREQDSATISRHATT
jgi:NACHT domain- and WD repeat-containing protein